MTLPDRPTPSLTPEAEIAALRRMLRETESRLHELETTEDRAVLPRVESPSPVMASPFGRAKASQTEMTSAPLIVWVLERDGRFVQCSEYWFEYSGVDARDGGIEPWTSYLHPEDERRVTDIWIRAQTTGESFAAQARLRCAGGEFKRWLIRGTSIGDSDRWYVRCSDIDQQRQTESRQWAREQLPGNAGRESRIGSWTVDLAEGRAHWSDEVCAIHGAPSGSAPTLEEAIGWFAPEWREKITSLFSACFIDGTPFDEELEIVNSAGGTPDTSPERARRYRQTAAPSSAGGR